MNKGKRPFVIKDAYIFSSTDKDTGDEGVVAELINGTWAPFLCTDKVRMEELKPVDSKIKDSAVDLGNDLYLIDMTGNDE